MWVFRMSQDPETSLDRIKCSDAHCTKLLVSWVHINDRPCLKDEPEGRKADDYLRELLDLPERYGLLCAVALGYSDFEPKPLPAYEGEERVMWK